MVNCVKKCAVHSATSVTPLVAARQLPPPSFHVPHSINCDLHLQDRVRVARRPTECLSATHDRDYLETDKAIHSSHRTDLGKTMLSPSASPCCAPECPERFGTQCISTMLDIASTKKIVQIIRRILLISSKYLTWSKASLIATCERPRRSAYQRRKSSCQFPVS